MRYLFQLSCPRCKRQSDIACDTQTAPEVNCGECLFNDVEIVRLTVLRSTPIAEARHERPR